MGSSPLQPVLANIFVGYHEAKLFLNIQKPISYFRYVDDIFIAHMKSFDIKMFYNEISNLHPSLKFGSKKETGRSLPFLNVFLWQTFNSLQMTVYHKPTFVGQYIPKSRGGQHTARGPDLARQAKISGPRRAF